MSATGTTRRATMSATTTAVTGKGARRAAIFVRSIMSVGWYVGLGMAATTLASFCVHGMAKADPPHTFEGRWAAKDRSLTLDLLRCGDGWCGIEVNQAGTCGRTVLRARGDEEGQLKGRLELATESQPYMVAVNFYRLGTSDPGELLISGHTGNRFEPWRRTYPYQVPFARSGDVTCRPDPKVS